MKEFESKAAAIKWAEKALVKYFPAGKGWKYEVIDTPITDGPIVVFSNNPYLEVIWVPADNKFRLLIGGDKGVYEHWTPYYTGRDPIKLIDRLLNNIHKALAADVRMFKQLWACVRDRE